MDMFCYQCQEALNNEACTKAGVCGKQPDAANMMDLLIYLDKGIAFYAKELDEISPETSDFLMRSLFATITNTNFSEERIYEYVQKAFEVRDQVKNKVENIEEDVPEAAVWYAEDLETAREKGQEVGILQTEDEDVRSLRELLTLGIKGMAAYGHHAQVLGNFKSEIVEFMVEGLAATLDDSLSADDLVGLVVECGNYAVKTMELLDDANTSAYGHPEPTQVDIGVRDNPGILVSGHDLKDLEQILEQTQGTGVDVYTHGEMLPANSYPAFKEYDHFVGNYGGSWWKQGSEFDKFNGPIVLTTNCLIPPKDSYKDRVFTTDMVGFDGVKHIESESDGSKDFSKVIEIAQDCDAPEQIEEGQIWGGFARNAVMEKADKIIEAVQEGAISQFVVMAGCDGRQNGREYYTEVAQELPEDAVILTAGCAKYRYNKLDLGDIGGIPRVLDAGQCNDSYSLAYIAMQLQEALDLDDINDLPISYDIAWYEQKAVTVLLALLALGVKGIRLGPTLPAFVSDNVLDVLVDNFDIKPKGSVQEDVQAMMQGE